MKTINFEIDDPLWPDYGQKNGSQLPWYVITQSFCNQELIIIFGHVTINFTFQTYETNFACDL